MLGLPGLPSFTLPFPPTLQASDISKMLGVLGLPSFTPLPPPPPRLAGL